MEDNYDGNDDPNFIMDAMFGDAEAKTKEKENEITGYLCSDQDLNRKKHDYCNDKILFRDFCQLMEKVMKCRDGTKAKVGLIFSSFKKSVMGADQSLYPFLRLVLPVNDIERGKIGLKQSSLARTYINALHLDKKTSTAAMQLIFFKDPAKRNIAITSAASTRGNPADAGVILGGDFSDVLEGVLKERVQTEYSNATLRDVHAILDALANASNEKAQTAIIRDKVINRFNATEQKWLARIIYRDLKIGLSVETIFNYFYPNAMTRYNETGSIKQVCEEEGLDTALAGSAEGEAMGTSAGHGGLQVFTKFNPMLAKGFNKEVNTGSEQVVAVEAAMRGQPFVMDLKLDGERICAHVGRRSAGQSSSSQQSEVMLVTRSGTDYTDNYRQLAEAVRDHVLAGHDVIIDGEVLAWDSLQQRHLPFGNNSTVAKGERDFAAMPAAMRSDVQPPTSWMKYVVFDLLYLAGPQSEELIQSVLAELHMQSAGETPSAGSGDITRLPLVARRRLLQRVLSTVSGRIEPVESRTVTAVGENRRAERQAALEDFFNDLVSAGEEGLVVKLMGSEYLLGEKSRAAGLWVKMKPEYGDQTTELDLVILGGFYGEAAGERGKGVSKFICGVRDDDDPSLFYTLAKVGTGYAVHELTALRERLQPAVLPWRDSDSGLPHLPHWTVSRKNAFRPDVMYDPQLSVVLQLKCGGIVDSAVYSSGLTLRFPRVERIRYDKPPCEVLTRGEVYHIKENFRKTTAGMATADATGDGELVGAKKRRGSGASKRPPKPSQRLRLGGVDDQFRVSSNHAAATGRVFEGCIFCVFECDFVYGRKLKVLDFPVVTHSPSADFEADDVVAAADGGGRRYSRRELIEAIRSQGGEVEASPMRPDCQIVASATGKRSLQLVNLIQEQSMDVLDFTYIVDCLAAGERLPPKSSYFLCHRKDADESTQSATDVYGLGFDEQVSVGELERLFGVMSAVVAGIHKAATATTRVTAKKTAAVKRTRDGKALQERGEHQVARRLQQCSAAEQDLLALSGKGWRDILSSVIAANTSADGTCISSSSSSSSRVTGTAPAITSFVLPEVNFMWCGGDFIFYVQAEGGSSLSAIAAESLQVTARVLKQRLLLYGAVVLEYLNRSVTHIVVPTRESQSWHADVVQHVRYNSNCTAICVEDVEQLLSGSETAENFHPSFRFRQIVDELPV